MNSFLAITCLLALTASSKADGLGGVGGLIYAPGHASADYYSYPKYAFEYAVKDPHTGDNKAQWEKRDGDVVKGAYSLVEPDGSLRVVEYWADDKSGFNAVVKRIGPNLHPTVLPAAPIYKAPIPVLESHGPIAPISIGSVAKYSGLATAPLITGPYLGGGAVSSANLYKEASPLVLKAPIAPIIPAPIIPEPVYKTSIAPLPIYKAPYGPAPILNLAPGPYYSTSLAKSAPILSAPYSGPILSSLGGYGGLKGGYLEELSNGLLNKGPLLPSYGYSNLGSLGGLGYDLGYKH